MAHGPPLYEPDSEPYRVTLLKWPRGNFSVTMELLKGDPPTHAEYAYSDYYDDYKYALAIWLEEMARRVGRLHFGRTD
jgi:hypothetical protein